MLRAQQGRSDCNRSINPSSARHWSLTAVKTLQSRRCRSKKQAELCGDCVAVLRHQQCCRAASLHLTPCCRKQNKNKTKHHFPSEMSGRSTTGGVTRAFFFFHHYYYFIAVCVSHSRLRRLRRLRRRPLTHWLKRVCFILKARRAFPFIYRLYA